MQRMTSASGHVLTTAGRWQLSDGELHYVWWFIQGSIMEADVRWRLRRAWGMCQRHAWGALAAEAAFRDNYFHGPAILYEDILERALRAFELAGPWPAARIGRRLAHRRRSESAATGARHRRAVERDPQEGRRIGLPARAGIHGEVH